MKKFLKMTLLSLVLCCTFVFAACGGAVERQFDSKASVNKGNDESYQASTKDDFVNYVGTATGDVGLNMTGYRMTGIITTNITEELADVPTTINYNIIVVENNGVPEMAAKMTMDGSDIYLFVKDGYMYCNTKLNIPGMEGEMKIKQKLPDDYDFSDLGIDNVVDFNSFFDMLNESADATITTYVEGETTRYKIEMAYKASIAEMAELSGSYTCYYVFESNKFAGFSMKLEYEQGTMEIDFSKYNGKISYPDLSEYEEIVI